MIDRHIDEGRADRTAYITEHETVTYGQLAERVNRCGNALLDAGIPTGGRMLMIVKDCPEFVYLYYGAIKAGIIPVPINTLLRAGDYQYMIDDSECAALIYSPEFEGEVGPALAGASRKPPFVTLTEGEGGIGEMIAAASDRLDPHPSDPMADCFWLYSSGSTGRPKGTVHRQRDLLVNAVLYSEAVLQISEDDIMFSAAKLFFRLWPCQFDEFSADVRCQHRAVGRAPDPGNDVPYYREVPPDDLLRCAHAIRGPVAARWKPRHPTSQAFVSAYPRVNRCRHPFSTAGRKWSVVRPWTASVRPRAPIFLSPTVPVRRRPEPAARFCRATTHVIVDDEGNDVAPGEVGRLLVRGESMAAYYWNQPEKTEQTMLGGDWLNTGDTYSQDEDGYYVYNGRSDDMIKVGGIWCSPIEIESRLIDHPAVLEAGVVGREDNDGLVKPEAHIILKEHGDANDGLAAELLEHCKDGLARYKYPRWFNFVEELPKTATGKIQRFKLRAGG